MQDCRDGACPHPPYSYKNGQPQGLTLLLHDYCLIGIDIIFVYDMIRSQFKSQTAGHHKSCRDVNASRINNEELIIINFRLYLLRLFRSLFLFIIK